MLLNCKFLLFPDDSGGDDETARREDGIGSCIVGRVGRIVVARLYCFFLNPELVR